MAVSPQCLLSTDSTCWLQARNRGIHFSMAAKSQFGSPPTHEKDNPIWSKGRDTKGEGTYTHDPVISTIHCEDSNHGTGLAPPWRHSASPSCPAKQVAKILPLNMGSRDSWVGMSGISTSLSLDTLCTDKANFNIECLSTEYIFCELYSAISLPCAYYCIQRNLCGNHYIMRKEGSKRGPCVQILSFSVCRDIFYNCLIILLMINRANLT